MYYWQWQLVALICANLLLILWPKHTLFSIYKDLFECCENNSVIITSLLLLVNICSLLMETYQVVTGMIVNSCSVNIFVRIIFCLYHAVMPSLKSLVTPSN